MPHSGELTENSNSAFHPRRDECRVAPEELAGRPSVWTFGQKWHSKHQPETIPGME